MTSDHNSQRFCHWISSIQSACFGGKKSILLTCSVHTTATHRPGAEHCCAILHYSDDAQQSSFRLAKLCFQDCRLWIWLAQICFFFGLVFGWQTISRTWRAPYCDRACPLLTAFWFAPGKENYFTFNLKFIIRWWGRETGKWQVIASESTPLCFQRDARRGRKAGEESATEMKWEEWDERTHFHNEKVIICGVSVSFSRVSAACQLLARGHCKPPAMHANSLAEPRPHTACPLRHNVSFTFLLASHHTNHPSAGLLLFALTFPYGNQEYTKGLDSGTHVFFCSKIQ